MPFQRKYAVKAATAMKQYFEKKQSNLLYSSDESFISLSVSLSKIPLKPTAIQYMLPIPHSIWQSSEICIITSDKNPQETKEMIKSMNIPQIKKILPYQKLKTHHKSYESKKKIAYSYDLFLADGRIVPLLPSVIGKNFFLHKKHPYSLQFPTDDAEKIQANILSAIDSTSVSFRQGPLVNIRVARFHHSPEQIADNIEAVLKGLFQLKQINGLEGIQSLHLMCVDLKQVALPIYRKLPVLTVKPIESFAGEKQSDAETNSDDDDDDDQNDDDSEKDDSDEESDSEVQTRKTVIQKQKKMLMNDQIKPSKKPLVLAKLSTPQAKKSVSLAKPIAPRSESRVPNPKKPISKQTPSKNAQPVKRSLEETSLAKVTKKPLLNQAKKSRSK